MKIDITPLLGGKVPSLHFEYCLTLDPDDENMPLPPDFTEFPDPIKISGELVDHAGYMELHAKVAAPYVTECYRCLDEIDGVFEMNFNKFVTTGAVSDEADEDDFIIASDGEIEFDEVLLDELMLNFPERFLCREDCPGLCPVCGKKLADGDCGCSSKKENDPRFDVLRDMLARMQNESESEAPEDGETKN